MMMNNSAGTSLATTTSSADRVSLISDAINTTAAKDFDIVLKDTQKEAVAQHTCETDFLHSHYTCMHCGRASSSHPLKAARKALS